MPWKCKQCGGAVAVDTTATCPSCGATKTAWSMVAHRTRQFVVKTKRFDLLRGVEPRALPPGSDGLEELGVVNYQRIRDLAIMLNPYARGGQYERFFEGRNNVDFSNDFIVIENEELTRRPDLHAVVHIKLLNQITGEM